MSILLLPRVLQVWHPYDYQLYVEMGNGARQGINPVGPAHYYPLPTVLWIFVPLSLMPDWFRLVWAIVPIVFVLMLHRREGLWFVFFTPLWWNITDAMLDGWLLPPLAWMLGNRPGWAGIGAVLLLTKPQLAAFAVAWSFWRWVATRDWKNLVTFCLGTIGFCLPAFLFDPNWVIRLLAVLPQRANESMVLLPLLTSSVWAWWWLGGGAVVVGVIVIAAAGGFAFLSWRRQGNLTALSLALNQLFVPVLFASNLTTLIPAVHGRRQILSVIAASLGAIILDSALGGFGGGYVLVPLVVMFFLAQNSGAMKTEVPQ